MMIILILSSEVGVLDIDPDEDRGKGASASRARCCSVDTVKGRVIDDDELKENYANRQPYGEWLDRNLIELEGFTDPE